SEQGPERSAKEGTLLMAARQCQHCGCEMAERRRIEPRPAGWGAGVEIRKPARCPDQGQESPESARRIALAASRRLRGKSRKRCDAIRCAGGGQAEIKGRANVRVEGCRSRPGKKAGSRSLIRNRRP